MTIKQLRPADDPPFFYSKVGPLAMSAAVVKDFRGYPVITGPDWVWFLALDASQTCIGFCAYLRKGDKLRLENAYVIPSERRKGVYRKLFAARMAHILTCEHYSELYCVATALSKPLLLTYGFQIKREHIHWTDMVLPFPAPAQPLPA